MGRRHGRLIRGQHEAIDIEFTAECPSLGREPAYLELFGVDQTLGEGEMVTVEEPGRFVYACRILDHTNVCAIVDARDIRPYHLVKDTGPDGP